MILKALACSGSTLGNHQPCCFQIGENMLLDMGAGASKLTLGEQLKISHIFLSHAHLDHVKDLAFFAENIFSDFKEPVVVHGSSDTLRKIKQHLMNDEIWPDFSKLPSHERSVLTFKPFDHGEVFKVNDLTVRPIGVNHPGGCSAFLFEHQGATLIYSGDTGPTQDVWIEAAKLGSDLKAVLIECSFPNRLQSVADVSGHLTAQTLEVELEKIPQENILIYVYHIKAPYLDEVVKEVGDLQDPRVRILLPGMKVQF